jgi:Fe(3+) dicitrate transport protein
MKVNSIQLKIWYVIMVILFSNFCASGQTGTIHGHVKDRSGSPIPHATIRLDQTSYGSLTDELGNYTLKKINPGNYIIQFTSVGFQSIAQSISIVADGTVEVNFETVEETSLLNEVPITGIRTITGMGYLDEVHDGQVYSGKKTEVLILDSMDANTAQNNPRQVLGRVPGANYSETEGSGFPSNGIGFRGLNPTQSVETNTRQNGYNITADLYGYPESYYLPPLEAVERIEVVRGAASLQYGPQFGGVINYILKKGSTSKPIELTTRQTAGSFGMYNSFNAIGGQVGKFNYYAYGQYQGMQGWRPNSDFRKLTGFGRVEYQATDKIKFGVEYSILRNHIHMPGGFSDSLFAVDSRKSYRARNWIKSPWNILTATLDWKLSQHTSLKVKSTLNNSARDLVWRNEDGGPQAMDNPDPVTSAYSSREVEHEGFKSYTTEVRLLAHYSLGTTRSVLAAGLRYFTGKMKRQAGGPGTTSSDFDLTLDGPYEKDLDFTTTNLAPFLENTFHFGKRLSVTPGLRYEYIHSTVKGNSRSHTDGSVVYSDYSKNRSILLAGAGLQYKTTSSTNLYANWSQAYRPLDYSSLTPLGTIVTVDKDLKDSKGFNADIGFRGSINHFLNFDISAFYLQCNDRVGLVEKTDAKGNPYPFRTNVANSVHRGTETYIEFNPVKAFTGVTKWSLSFFNSLALIRAKYGSGEFTGKTVEYAPAHINRFGTNLGIGKFSTTFLVSSTAKSYGDANNSETPSADAVAGVIPAYTVLDWSATWRIKAFNVKFGCNNLADKRYFTLRTGEYPGPGIIPAIGRSFYFGVGFKI